MSKPHEEISEQETVEKEDMLEINFEKDLSMFCEETLLELTESTDICVQDELISQLENLNISKDTDNYNIVNDLSFSSDEVVENSVLNERSNSSMNERPSAEIESNSMMPCVNSEIETDAEIHLNIPQFSGSLLSHLTENILSDVSDKERAVKILLHTRNFREYCNHLISKDIDDVTFSLLDDLARFQDRLHQKDPIKARMKRRLVYGVKEVKKHIKLRKLKCIIIAVDIENVETQGGLNDVLNEIKISAVDHRIPCVFALSRKALGRVCRKPVPVSCVGVFSYEGSEVNFKKMVELQSQGKTDYTEIFNKLLMKINDDDVSVLIKAKNEAPETLRDVRTNILSNFFVPPYSMKSEDEDLKSNEDISNVIDIAT